jgi:hypothetical protein
MSSTAGMGSERSDMPRTTSNSLTSIELTATVTL